MNEESYSSKRNGLARNDEGGEKLDPWTKRLDLLLKAIIALATILSPIYLTYLTRNAKEEIKTEAKEALTKQTADVKETLREHDTKLEQVKEDTAYTKAVNADWLAERTGNPQAVIQAEQARNKLEALEPAAMPPSLSASAKP